MAGGNKRVESIPADWIDLVRPRVESGQRLKQIVAEALAIHAELLVLARNQRPRAAHRPTPSPP